MQFDSKIHGSSEGGVLVRDTSCNLRDMGMVIFRGPQLLPCGLFQYPPVLKTFSMKEMKKETVKKKAVSERTGGPWETR